MNTWRGRLDRTIFRPALVVQTVRGRGLGRIFTIVTIGLVSAGLLLSPMTRRHGVAAGLASDAQARFTAILQRSEKWPRLADTYTDRRDTITVATLVYANENCIRIVSGFGDPSLWGKTRALRGSCRIMAWTSQAATSPY